MLTRFHDKPLAVACRTTTFNIGFYPPAFIPLLLGFVITAVETVGDIQARHLHHTLPYRALSGQAVLPRLEASCDVSGLPIEGPDADSRIQGGLLADGVNSFLACLMTCLSDAKVAGEMDNGW